MGHSMSSMENRDEIGYSDSSTGAQYRSHKSSISRGYPSSHETYRTVQVTRTEQGVPRQRSLKGEQDWPQRKPLPVLPRKPKEIAERDDKIENLEAVVHDLSEKNALLVQDIQGLQGKAFKNFTDARYTPKEDSKIQRELGALRKEMDGIAKDFTLERVHDIDKYSLEEQEKLYRDLCEVIDVKIDDFGTITCSAIMEEIRTTERAGQIFFTALLSSAVHKQIISNPFFFAANSPNAESGTMSLGALEPSWSQILFSVYQQQCQIDSREANLWRSQTMRFLFPTQDTKNDIESKERQQLQTSWVTASGTAVDVFRHGTSKLLRRNLTKAERDEYKDRLDEIFQKAALFSIDVWKQRVAMRCQYLDTFAQKRFSGSSPELQAHAIHKHDDPQDRRLDGKAIRTVVHPAVFGVGTPQGEDYETSSRVWAPAIVVLDE